MSFFLVRLETLGEQGGSKYTVLMDPFTEDSLAENGVRLLFVQGWVPQDIYPGVRCHVSGFPFQGHQAFFESKVRLVQGRAVYLSPTEKVFRERRSRRIETLLPVEIQGAKDVVPGTILNICEDVSGVGLSSDVPLALKDPVKLVFLYEGKRLLVEGRIAWGRKRRCWGIEIQKVADLQERKSAHGEDSEASWLLEASGNISANGVQ